jgi:cytochrome c oxidase assembly protein subunit 15
VAVVVHFLHRLGALLVTLCVGWTMARIFSQHRAEGRLLRPAWLLGGLVLLQLTLGALTIWTRRAVWPMTAHVAVGAAVLATSVVITLRAARLTAVSATSLDKAGVTASAQGRQALSFLHR